MISVTPLTYLPIKQGIVKSNDINDFKSWQSLLIYASLSLNLHSLDPPQGTKRDATADLTFSVITNYHRRNHVWVLLQSPTLNVLLPFLLSFLAKTHITYRREMWGERTEIKLKESTMLLCKRKGMSLEVLWLMENSCGSNGFTFKCIVGNWYSNYSCLRWNGSGDGAIIYRICSLSLHRK